MRRSRSSTQLLSVRIDTTLLLKGKLLKARSQRFTHSFIYAQGLLAILKEMVDRGDRIPEDPLEELTRIEQETIEEAETRLQELALLRKKQAAAPKKDALGSRRTIRVYDPDTGRTDIAVVDDS